MAGSDALPRLQKREPLARGLRRTTVACCQPSLEIGAHDGDEEAVHLARRGLKRARAILRLAERAEIPGAREAREGLSRCARQLSTSRDADVLKKVGRKVAARVGKSETSPPSAAFSRGRSRQRRQWDRLQVMIAAQRRRIEELDWNRLPKADLNRALRKSFRRVQRRARKVSSQWETKEVHAWRKSVIVLREQLRVLATRLPAEAGAAANALHRLASHLGDALDANLFLSRIDPKSGMSSAGGRRRSEAAARRMRQRALASARRSWPRARKSWKRLQRSLEN